jgi:cation diffusion facilitator CzcD-associated flavoprotein CzcO
MSCFTTSFGFHSTAADVIAGVDLTGKRAIVTGGAAGIGIETARALSTAGASVTLAVRRARRRSQSQRSFVSQPGTPRSTSSTWTYPIFTP